MRRVKINPITPSIVCGNNRKVNLYGKNLDMIAEVTATSSSVHITTQAFVDPIYTIIVNAPETGTISFTVIDNEGNEHTVTVNVINPPTPEITEWPKNIPLGFRQVVTVRGTNLLDEGQFDIEVIKDEAKIENWNILSDNLAYISISSTSPGKIKLKYRVPGLTNSEKKSGEIEVVKKQRSTYQRKRLIHKLAISVITLMVISLMVFIINLTEPDTYTASCLQKEIKPGKLAELIITTNRPLKLMREHYFMFPADIIQVGETELVSDFTYSLRILPKNSCDSIRTVYLHGTDARFDLECK